MSAFLIACLIAVGACAAPAGADEAYQLEAERPFWLRAMIDGRVARPGRAPSWWDRGPGRTRYGGHDTGNGFEHKTRVTASQVALELGGVLPGDLVPRLQVNLETPSDDQWRPLVVEANLRREWGTWQDGWSAQAGINPLPFSLEHTGPAWTSPYTLTPAALNAWTWEEIRPVGLEAEWWRALAADTRFSLLGGFAFGTDQVARVLAGRGWVLSDYVSGVNADLPLARDGQRNSVFNEDDGRPALYVLATLADRRRFGELILGYFDNLGDQGAGDAWETRFGTLGAVLHPLPFVDLLVQYLYGDAQTRGNPLDTGLQAFYALVSAHHRGHRISFRYDDFRLRDRDSDAYRTGENGRAFTVAYLFELGLHHRFGFEYMLPTTHRAALGHDDPSDDGWQLSYRFRY